MFCTRCSTHNPATANFCFNCGMTLPTATQPPPTLSQAPASVQLQEPMPARTNVPAGYYNPPVSSFYPPGEYRPLPSGHPLLHFHPLAQGTYNLPHDLLQQPGHFYSYVNQQGRTIFARRASFQARVGAGLLDLLALILPFLIIFALFNAAALEPGANPALAAQRQLDPAQAGWTQLLLYSLIFGYFYFTGVAGGQSLGKRVTRIRVMQLNGLKPGRLTTLLRYLPGYALSSNIFLVSLVALVVGALSNSGVGLAAGTLAFGWGFWWCAWDPLRQTWHDKLARTLVVDTREYTEGVDFFR